MPLSEEDVGHYLERTGMATPGQIEEARRKSGGRPILEVLLREGIITAAQRDAVEKKFEDRGIQQLGSYKLLKRLGAGGMGEVFLVENIVTREKAALKILPKDLASDPEFRRRFVREATEAAKLEHPNLVRALTAGEEHGYSYYVMEYCEGEPLTRHLPLHVPAAVAIVRQIARGLGHAHEKGIIHRDVKPDNILVTPSGAKLLDLGLAKNILDGSGSKLTMTGETMGTPHYMSPEQARGSREIDGRADLNSLGATFFHLVTGQTPFTGGSAFEIISRHLTEPVPDACAIRREIPERIGGMIRKMMAKDPADRYPDCASLIADLESPTRSPKRLRWPYFAGAAVLAAAAGIIAFRPKSSAPGFRRENGIPCLVRVLEINLKRGIQRGGHRRGELPDEVVAGPVRHAEPGIGVERVGELDHVLQGDAERTGLGPDRQRSLGPMHHGGRIRSLPVHEADRLEPAPAREKGGMERRGRGVRFVDLRDESDVPNGIGGVAGRDPKEDAVGRGARPNVDDQPPGRTADDRRIGSELDEARPLVQTDIGPAGVVTVQTPAHLCPGRLTRRRDRRSVRSQGLEIRGGPGPGLLEEVLEDDLGRVVAETRGREVDPQRGGVVQGYRRGWDRRLSRASRATGLQKNQGT